MRKRNVELPVRYLPYSAGTVHKNFLLLVHGVGDLVGQLGEPTEFPAVRLLCASGKVGYKTQLMIYILL